MKSVQRNQPETSQPESMGHADYVPLPPTETGHKRHDAHQLQAPNFLNNRPEYSQSQHSEMYLG
ncbi:MAG: hypothetical protein JKY95_13770 [Planctomycetaceae bacterium]|nr:hypothetical protein [Planctomycetaceae bacterium]